MILGYFKDLFRTFLKDLVKTLLGKLTAKNICRLINSNKSLKKKNAMHSHSKGIY
jgi:hypothetical protein